MATLAEVAAEAGVSPSAVSRHLNHRIVLPKATVARIEAAILRLNYTPNIHARRLSTGRAEVIGLVTPEISNPFFAAIAAAVEREASHWGYTVNLTSTGGVRKNEVDALDSIRSHLVDGVIMTVARPDDSGQLAKRISKFRNVVLVDEDVPGVRVPRISGENEVGAYLATRHLIDAGHRHIGHVGGPRGLSSTEERFAGYCRALAESGLPIIDDYIRFGDYSRGGGATATGELLSLILPPTALFTGSDLIALGAYTAARQRGLALPDDLSVTGFGDLAFAPFVVPALTSVRQPIVDLGRLAVTSLLATLAREPTPPLIRLPLELVARASVTSPAGGSK